MYTGDQANGENRKETVAILKEKASQYLMLKKSVYHLEKRSSDQEELINFYESIDNDLYKRHCITTSDRENANQTKTRGQKRKTLTFQEFSENAHNPSKKKSL